MDIKLQNMKLKQIIKRLTMTKDPKLQKEVVLGAWEHCDHFFTGLQMSCDETVVVKLSKIAEIQDDDDGFDGGFTFDEFTKIYDEATQVNYDEQRTKELINEAIAKVDIYEWNNFYRKILLKKFHEDMPMDVIIETLQELTGYQNPL